MMRASGRRRGRGEGGALGGTGQRLKMRQDVADTQTSIADLKAMVQRFVAERAWEPFHSPKNLAMGVAVEAAELMECFLWVDLPASYEQTKDPTKREAIADEMADILCYLLNLSNVLGIDLSEALSAKMIKNAQKYPAAKYRGKYEVAERKAKRRGRR